MADISLRAYLREIDELIERDQLDAAIAHCRHILQIYPKHLDTYRLLGKAYLEAKRFGDAADIFQRVLSAVPDDFVSHIGMAIVREDEGNMDAAIWHMERAFETNPANPAIRQELSRLIGRRDGIEPHKIRLTRGALSRQYAQGELYPQAIAELRSALQEDPDRPELEVLLAKMYWRAGQPEEARSISKQILEKLPFSYEANRIMAALFEGEGQSDKAGEYHRRLAALEPYAAFSDSSSIDPTSVDSNAVRIDHSEWIPGQPLPSGEPSQPDWVASLGVDLSLDDADDVESEASPPWLTDIEKDAPETAVARQALMNAEIPQDTESPATPEGEIPEWMKEAGWAPSTGEAEDGPVSFTDSEMEALNASVPTPEMSDEDGELAPAEIPNWLQDKAPKQDDEEIEQREEPQAVEESDGMMPDWLSEIADEAEDVSPDPGGGVTESEISQESVEEQQDALPEKPTDPDSPEVPSWIDDLSPGATSTIITWLGDRPEAEAPPDESMPAPEPDIAPSQASTADATPPGDVPSWLDDIAEGDEVPDLGTLPSEGVSSASPAPAEGAPSWLAGVAEAASHQTSAEAPTPPASEEAVPTTSESEDDWLQNLRDADAQAEPVDDQPEAAAEWLDGVEEPVSTTEEVEEPGAPDWLRGVREPDEVVPDIQPTPAEADKPPDWLKSGDELKPDTARADVPDWLQGIADQSPESGAVAEEAAAIGLPESEAAGSAPDWLQDFSGEGEPGADGPIDPQSIQEIEAELSAATEPAGVGEESTPAGIGVEDELDDEEVFRWLESLADRQEGDEAGPGMPGAQQTSAEQAAPEMRQTAPPEEPEASLQWLEELAAERGLDVDVTPDLQPSAPTPPGPAPTTAPAETDEDSPDWLREMAAAPADETLVSIPKPPITKPVDSTPVEPEPQLDETVIAAAPEPLADEAPEIPSWLDDAASAAAGVPAEPPVEAGPPPEPETAPPPIPEEQEPAPAAVVEEAPIAEPVPAPPPETSPPPVDTPAKVAKPTTPEAEEKKSRPYKEPPTEAEILLQGARQALAAGDAGRALSDYKKMINRKQELNTVIDDLEEALDRYPNLPTMWQALGDAYMKADRLAEAIQAYQRGMEVA